MDTYYDLLPKVVSEGCTVKFRLRSRYEPILMESGSSLVLRIRSLNNFKEITEIYVTVDTAGEIQFDFTPGENGEYQLILYSEENPGKPITTTAFYVVRSELIKLRPCKGDFHMHTCYSDGRQSPGYMAAHGRALGFDFAAITDHRIYDSSLEAIERAEEYGMDILLFPGEEINYYLGLGHIVSINADRSISDTVRGKDYTIDELAERIAEEVGEELDDLDMLPGKNRALFGYYCGIVKKIHQAGGIAITAHPYWTSQGTYDLARKTYEQILESRIFDAVEVFGGQGFQKNMLSLARINQYHNENKKITLLGNSDAHNAYNHTMGQTWTIVFSESLTHEGILKGIKEGRTVPCVTSGGSDNTIAVGDTELVEYSYFLLREFFPRHDEICTVLGGLYKRALRTGRQLEGTKDLQAELQDFYDEYFAC